MKRMFVLVSLFLPGLMMGCASDKDLQAMRADAQALERQSSERQQTVEARLQSVSDRVAQFEKSQAEARRDLARTAATLDELRIQFQRLQGDIQETQHRVRRGTTGGEGISATKLADFETLDYKYPAVAIASTKTFIARQRATALNFIRGELEGIHAIRTQKSFALNVLRKYMRISEADILEEGYQYALRFIQAKPYPTLDEVRAVLDENSKMPQAAGAKPENFIDLSLLRELEKEKFFDRLR
jgi:TolA-binding protein